MNEAERGAAREKLAKYEAWAREIEARQAALARSRTKWMRAFTVIVIASPLGFFFGAWMGASTVFTGVMFSLFGVYTVLVREAEYRRDLARTRAEIAQLRRDAEVA